MIILQNLTYIHPDKDLLFDNLNLIINGQNKIALTGNNGSGKSTLLKIMAGILQPSKGNVKTGSNPYYIPQHFGQYNDMTIAQALGISAKLRALRDILDGEVTSENMEILEEDWSIEERCHEALANWKLQSLDMSQAMHTLSGGQKTKVFLAGIAVHNPEIVLLDEPGNHMDSEGRILLYDFIRSHTGTLLVVSHDRALLNIPDMVYELSREKITVYGGNYDFYITQKQIETQALHQDVKSREKALRKAKEVERETAERKQKLDARGKKKQEKAGVPTIAMNTLRNNAEKSTSRLKDMHTEKVDTISGQLQVLRKELPDTDKMKLGFDNTALHKGKILVNACNINVAFGDEMLWKQALDILVTSGERIALKGRNGSGKTTLIRILLGEVKPMMGVLKTAEMKTLYIDQDYSLIDNQQTVYEQVQLFSADGMQEHEIKICLSRFLFTKETWNKPCIALSGGERMRLMLCCLTTGAQAPDLIILDEPTNNLDIQHIEILTHAINSYQGTLIVVSHDAYFLEQINTERTIELGE